jgi:hypothetical protein
MTKRSYKPPVKKDDVYTQGWMSTFPIPKKEAAEIVKQGYEMRYEDVEMDQTPEGYVIRYRRPRKGVK